MLCPVRERTKHGPGQGRGTRGIVALDAVEPFIESDAIDFTHQFILPMRDELGDHSAENKQPQ
jgi:hypothetical protein